MVRIGLDFPAPRVVVCEIERVWVVGGEFFDLLGLDSAEIGASLVRLGLPPRLHTGYVSSADPALWRCSRC